MNPRFLRKLFLSLFTLLFMLTINNVDAFSQDTEGDSVVDVINASTDHTILSQLLVEAQLVETLNMDGPYTVLAPTDEAFNELGTALTQLRENPQELQGVLVRHLFQGAVSAEEVTEAIGLEIETGDIEADNGVIHVINQVILQN
jgi:uncharacterized surface protein with fasciclin (FAS1) repeats